MSNAGILGHAGSYLDPVTNTYPLGNGYRMYLPWLMRFNAPDSSSPFGSGGVNSYAYCVADPINKVDPTGHEGELNQALIDEAHANLAVIEAADAKVPRSFENKAGAAKFAPILDQIHREAKPHDHLSPEVKGQLDAWVAESYLEKGQPDPEPPWLKLEKMPKNEKDFLDIFTKALEIGQIKINFLDKDPRLVFTWDPKFELDGERIYKIDELMKNIMRRFGAAQTKGSSHFNLYEVRSSTDMSHERLLSVALRREPGVAGFFKPIILPEVKVEYGQTPNIRQVYRTAFNKVAAEFKKRFTDKF